MTAKPLSAETWIKPRPDPLGCYDCGRPYGSAGFPDLVIPDDAWRAISPTGDDGGLLCPSCLCARLAISGITCPGSFMSGPLVANLIEQQRDASRAETAAVVRERDEMVALLTDPVAVHLNMLRGGIARPSVANIVHLYQGAVVDASLAADLVEGLERARQDINWMLNNRQFLNGHCFGYIETTIAKAHAGIGAPAPKGERLEITVETPAETARSYDGIRRALGLEPAPKGEKGEPNG